MLQSATLITHGLLDLFCAQLPRHRTSQRTSRPRWMPQRRWLARSATCPVALGDCPETARREMQSAELLIGIQECYGFAIERGVAGMPAAFMARYGQGRPVIGGPG